jgi:hypothetical protein
MTDTTEAKHDVDALLRKNAELLGELKAAKARLAEVEAEREAARGEAQAARDTMRRVQLDEPLEQALGGAFVAPWRIMRPLVEEHFEVGLDGDGKPQVVAKANGEAVPIGSMFAAVMAVPDLAAAMRPARGGGARGNDGPDPHGPQAKPQAKVASPFGLR